MVRVTPSRRTGEPVRGLFGEDLIAQDYGQGAGPFGHSADDQAGAVTRTLHSR